jgi:hypothetical protein
MSDSTRPFTSTNRTPFVAAFCALLASGTGCPLDEGFAALSVDLTVEPTAVEFDPLFGGSPVLLNLVVQNGGGAPARLSRTEVVSTTGPAVSLSVSPVGDVVPAHGALEIRVTALAPIDALGLFTADIALSFDDGLTLTVPFVAIVRVAPSCDDDNPCTEDSFEGTACRNVLSVDGTPCDDENACTTATLCFAGSCMGEAVQCSDGQDCTVDTCDPTSGCVNEPLAERCDDEDPCTEDVCASETGCSNPPKDPGALCYFGGCEEVGLCFNGVCEMHDVPNGFPCSDGDACTIDDTCQEGVCGPGIVAEAGPEDPLVLVEGPVPALLCAEAGSGCVTHALEAVEILAAHRRVDGNVQTVWRTDYVWSDTGFTCDPLVPILFGSNARKVPAAEGACECIDDSDCTSGTCDLSSPSCGVCGPAIGEEAPPPPPLPPVCGAAVFLSRTTNNDVITTQLTTTTGAVAASLVDTASQSAQVGVAHVLGTSSVVVELFNGSGWALDTVVLDRDTSIPATSWRIATLAMDLTPTRLSVIAIPEWRDVINQTVGCNDDGLCLGVPVELWNTQPSSILDADIPSAPLIATLDEWADPRCAVALGAGRPLIVEDLHITLDPEDDDITHVALRMDPFACGDYATNVVLSVPRVYRFSTTLFETSAFAHAGPLDHVGPPWILEVAQVDATTAAAETTSAGVVSFDMCDPSNDIDGAGEDDECFCLTCEGCPCDCPSEPADPIDSCTRSAVVRLSTFGAVSVADTLLSNLPAESAEAHTVVVNDDLFTVARTGNVLSFLGRADDGSLIYKPAPALPADARWRDRLIAGTSIVAGLVDNTSGFDTQPGGVEPVPINPAFPSTWVVSQGFACGAEAETPPPFVCTMTSECPGGLVCDFSSCACSGDLACTAECVGVCLAPIPEPVSDAGVDDGGSDAGVEILCLVDDMCGAGSMCLFGESCLLDPLCDADAPNGCPCYGLCVPWTFSPDDAGVLEDGGFPDDAGVFDDAGAVTLDGGSLGDAGHAPIDGG